MGESRQVRLPSPEPGIRTLAGCIGHWRRRRGRPPRPVCRISTKCRDGQPRGLRRHDSCRARLVAALFQSWTATPPSRGADLFSSTAAADEPPAEKAETRGAARQPERPAPPLNLAKAVGYLSDGGPGPALCGCNRRSKAAGQIAFGFSARGRASQQCMYRRSLHQKGLLSGQSQKSLHPN